MRDPEPDAVQLRLFLPTDDRAAPPLFRAAAFGLDAVLAALYHLTAGAGRWHYTAAGFVLYSTVSLALWGRTLGKAALGLEVVRSDGERLRWWAALLRSSAGYLASAFLLLGYLHALRDERGRCWHDVLFDSEVRRQPGVLSLRKAVESVDRWTEALDAWQRRLLSRYKRLQGLVGFVLKLTGAVTVLRDFFTGAFAWLKDKVRPDALGKAAAVPGQAASSAAAAATASTAAGSAAAAVGAAATALVLAGGSVGLYQVASEIPLLEDELPPASELELPTPLGTGDVQVTLTWEGPADIDLHVIDPTGREINYQNRGTEGEGWLDVDAHANCVDAERPAVENVFWGPGRAPAGTYEVRVHHFDSCGGSETTRWRVDLKVDGDLQAFQGRLAPGSEPQFVTRFTR